MNIAQFENKRLLITGGTGSVGMALVERVLADCPAVAEIVVMSRDEQKQHEMQQRWPSRATPVRYLLGDIRDRERLMTAMRGAHLVIHSAAMKHVPAAEENPVECIKTNLLGSHNIVEAALASGVERVVALSTDKAALPINVYGASKLILEKLFLHADRDPSNATTRFSVVRFGNVFGSKGSVVPLFLARRAEGYLPITHPEMTRFSITMKQAIDMVLFAATEGWGGEIVLPVAPSYRITDVAEAVAAGVPHRIVGIRPGEKLHEIMYSELDVPNTARMGGHFIICPTNGRWTIDDYCRDTGATPVPRDGEYHSGRNHDWLSEEAIRALVRTETTS